MAANTEMRAALEMAALANEPRSFGHERGAAVALPDGFSLRSVEAYQDRPNRITAAPVFAEPAALALYLNLYSAGFCPAIFSYPDGRRIVAVIDHHDVETGESAAEGGGAVVRPRWGGHAPSFAAEFDPQYAVWRALDGRTMSQREAGEVLEARALDIVRPDAASIMDLLMTFEVTRKVAFKQATRLRSGERQFMYVEEDESRGSITLPETMTILVPVFTGLPAQEVEVRLRYRLIDGKLSFTFIIADREALEREAFAACESALYAELERKLPVFRCAGA